MVPTIIIDNASTIANLIASRILSLLLEPKLYARTGISPLFSPKTGIKIKL